MLHLLLLQVAELHHLGLAPKSWRDAVVDSEMMRFVIDQVKIPDPSDWGCDGQHKRKDLDTKFKFDAKEGVQLRERHPCLLPSL